MKMIVTRDQILDAIEIIQTHKNAGLCLALSRPMTSYYLDALGAREWSIFKWPLDARGKQQRLMFLAFMLTWYDEIEKGRK